MNIQKARFWSVDFDINNIEGVLEASSYGYWISVDGIVFYLYLPLSSTSNVIVISQDGKAADILKALPDNIGIQMLVCGKAYRAILVEYIEGA